MTNYKKKFFNNSKTPTVLRLNISNCAEVKTRLGSPVDRRPFTTEAPPIGKIFPFIKMAVTLELITTILMPLKIKNLHKFSKIGYFMTKSTICDHEGVAAP